VTEMRHFFSFERRFSHQVSYGVSKMGRYELITRWNSIGQQCDAPGDVMVAIHIYNTRLDSCSCQEHEHARVRPALTYSFHQCPGEMPGFILGYGEKGPTSGLKPPGMKEALGPNMELQLATLRDGDA